ncbi:fibronectin type III domain-containing protein [Pelagicoccus mobilis]|uniref:Fibronectin type III domain-containing protein n=1 Tax=Pelagicoccus mobilis TaxID=415221 RepID=A0A934RXH7_9BACT|nr:fibronectin type III domain-containing protein [Pelagicoccus mobilis]MBK1876616.1 fibronectin type III domain-containing protein [Pelagicoccus mobilis]
MRSPHISQFRTFRQPLCLLSLLLLGVVGAWSASAGQLSLTWQDNSDNEDGFEVERALVGESFGLLSTVGPDSESYVDDAVVPGLEYEYRVRAFNAFGYSGYTNVSVGAAANSAPEIGEIDNVSMLKGESAPVAEFSFADAESSASDLLVEAISSNLSVVPLDGISVELRDDGRGHVVVEPRFTAGAADITVILSDGAEAVQRVFSFEVLNNLAPTISSVSAVETFDGMSVAPVGFTVSDKESDASELLVTASSLDESLVASDSISIGGSGSNRTVAFETLPDVSGTATIRLTVSDGVNQTHGALQVAITRNRAPELNGLEELYTIESGGRLSGVAFDVADVETAVGNLEVDVRSSNSAIVGPIGLRLEGTGANRTLDVTPNQGAYGSVEITVSVSDGGKTTSHTFTLRVLPPEAIVKILGFSIEERLAVIEVENRPNATFSLWKIHSRDGAWEKVDAAEISADATSTIIIDLTPVESAVCYRVIASE